MVLHNTPLIGAARNSAPPRATLALALPTHKRHFASARFQFFASSTDRRACSLRAIASA